MATRLLPCLCPLLALATACGGGSAEPRVEAGAWSVAWDEAGPGLRLQRGDELLLDLPADGLQLGRVDALEEDFNYDPHPILVPDPVFVFHPPLGLRWLSVTSGEVVERSAQALGVRLLFGPRVAALLRVEAVAEGRFRLSLVPEPGGDALAYVRLRPRLDPQEGLYGLGAHEDQVNQRGAVRAMQLEMDPQLESGYNEAHVPVPLVLGTRGWALFVESDAPGVIDAAAAAADRLDVLFGTGPATAQGLVFHLFGAEHPLDLTRRYFDATGDPSLPAPWALGPWLWRDENADQAEFVADLQAMRDLDLPCTAAWVDRPYASGVNTFDFEAARFPDPAGMIAEAHELGYRVALWHTPYLDSQDPACDALRGEAEAQGYYPPQTGLLLNHWGKPVDLTNPAAFAWWQGLIRRYTDMGIEGFKLDYAEDVVPGVPGARNVWRFHDGRDERSMHHHYAKLYHQVYAETLPATGGFLLGRAGKWGDQVNVSVIWPGDLDADLVRHGQQVSKDGETYVAVGGLAASMFYGLTLGPSGFPFYGADTGGYRHSPPDKETFTRWFEQTALSSVMQIGNSANTVAWEPDAATGYDEEMLGWYRTYTRLHLRLWAYAWTLARRLAVDGRPLQRPFGLQEPAQGEHPDDQYFFGDHLLVAPVLDRGVREREVIFPAGGWIDWWDGSAHAGPGRETIAAPLEKLPLYLRAGAVVPLLRRHGYEPSFRRAFPGEADPVTPGNYAQALQAYQATLITPGAFDRFLAGDAEALEATQM
ncbi:MAG TPA: glycoside hydrolase family 31 protein, partial [Myxococcota bacterium]|nr:glycoside hydrolase family 31 protein [Myxococcota bacterium]